jgi:hypothetical protein
MELTSFRSAEYGEGMHIYAFAISNLDVAIYLPRHMVLSEPQLSLYTPLSTDYGWDRIAFSISEDEQEEICEIINRNGFWSAKSDSDSDIEDGTQRIMVGNAMKLGTPHTVVLNNSFPPSLSTLNTQLLDAIQQMAVKHQLITTPATKQELESVFAWLN